VQVQLNIAEDDERQMEECRHLFPGDVEYKRTFYAQKAAQKRARRTEKRRRKAFIEAQLNGPSMIGDDNDRWDDLFFTTDEASKQR
jgi:hypothetical protein